MSRRLIARVLGAVLIATVGTTALGHTVARLWHVEGRSMEPQLHDGSFILVDELGPQVRGYARGDIVVLPTPEIADFPLSHLIKRIVAMPGDRVLLADGVLYVNGRALDEPYVDTAEVAAHLPGRSLKDVVPPGAVMVLGDRRWASLDSKDFGPVPLDGLRGRVWLIVDPTGLSVPLAP